MNTKKAKYLRRILRPSLEKGSWYKFIAYPSIYTNTRGQTMLKYKFQYLVDGGMKLYKQAKKLYKNLGKLPR